MVQLAATLHPHKLHFKAPAGTSRGTLYDKQVYFLVIKNTQRGITGIGECTTIPSLSPDDRPDYKENVQAVCDAINEGHSFETIYQNLDYFPSIRFGLETAIKDLENGGQRMIYDTPFAYGQRSIKINGLIWMNDFETMLAQIREKVSHGFECIKLKIGAIDWQKELELLAHIRANYAPEQVEIRVDANGAFDPSNVIYKLQDLAKFKVHSIEQPIAPRQPEAMADVCERSPVPVALDEELISREDTTNKAHILDKIKPHYIILKPGLLGGFRQSDEWIELANERHIGWWATSALESNIGLNAIAQWTDSREVNIPQGLGTGGLYTNNIASPLEIGEGHIWINPEKEWGAINGQ